MNIGETLSGNVYGAVPLRPRLRLPLVWILFPQLLAYALCEAGFAFPVSIPAFALALGLAAVALVAAFKNYRRESPRFTLLWKCTLVPAVLFIAGIWWSACAPPQVDWKLLRLPDSDVVATLCVENTFRSVGKSWTGLARIEKIEGLPGLPSNARAYYSVPKEEFEQAPMEGMTLEVRARASSVAHSQQFAGGDTGFRDFLLSRRADTYLRVRKAESPPPTALVAFKDWCGKQKHKIIDHFVVRGDPWECESRVACAMVLGERSLLLPEQQSDFATTGVVHIFAISGLHVAIFSAALLFVFSRLFTSRTLCSLVTLGVILFCIQIAGPSPSSIRAFFMMAFLFFSRFLGRSVPTENALVAVAFFALCVNPFLLENLGFIFSYGAVAAILFYGSPLERFIKDHIQPYGRIPHYALTRRQRLSLRLWNNFVGLTCVSIAAFLVSTTLTASYFGLFTALSIIANLLVIPVASVVLIAAISAIFLWHIPLVGVLAALLWYIVCWCVYVIEVFTGTLAQAPLKFRASNLPHWFGSIGVALMLVLFFAGASFPALRDRPWLRFTLPPIALILYYIITRVALALTCIVLCISPVLSKNFSRLLIAVKKLAGRRASFCTRHTCALRTVPC